MDVSVRVDVERVHDEMRSTNIITGGVINGAMVLSDGLFESMSLENAFILQCVQRPKIQLF